jgi:hypothetical protein
MVDLVCYSNGSVNQRAGIWIPIVIEYIRTLLYNGSHLQHCKKVAVFQCTTHKKVVTGNNYPLLDKNIPDAMLFWLFNVQPYWAGK